MKCLKMVANKYGWSRVTRDGVILCCVLTLKGLCKNTYTEAYAGSMGTPKMFSSGISWSFHVTKRMVWMIRWNMGPWVPIIAAV